MQLATLTPDQLERLTSEQRAEIVQILETYEHDWDRLARDKQRIPDGRWRTWLILAGRGFGKTRTGAETVRRWVNRYPYVNLIGATVDDARDIMIEGESGILAICPNSERPRYLKNDRQLVWPNGAKSLIFTADEPERLRGKQHMKVWCDELASWRYPESWVQMRLGLRLGDNPQAVVTTTPKPLEILRKLSKDKTTHVTLGTTYENRSNLAADFFADIVSQYEGTRLGRQELHAEFLDDVEGALWSHDMIERKRVKVKPDSFRRIVVAVDPSGSAKKEADEAGIVVAGLAPCRCTGTEELHGFVLQDLSGRYSPADMGAKAVKAYHDWDADRVVAEDNFGGQIIDDLIHLIDKTVPYKAVHASRGKIVRAEPVAALYERGRVHHVGMHGKLEDELCTYTPQEPKSPGRMDALVWALTDLMLDAPWMGTAASYDSPASDEYWEQAEAEKKRTNLQGFE